MNQLRRFAGIIWITLGPLSMLYLIKTAAAEVARNPLLDTKIQWSVFVLIFFPIAMGIVVFGCYAMKGEYDLPENASDEI